jgi:hypothetical protein
VAGAKAGSADDVDAAIARLGAALAAGGLAVQFER